MNPELLLIRYGELSLKGKATRSLFEHKLLSNIRAALQASDLSFSLKKEWGRIYVYTDTIPEVLVILQKIFGITSLSPSYRTASDLHDISECAVLLAQKILTPSKSFALRTTRTGTHTYTSQEASSVIGNAIVQKIGARVDLTHPDVELFIDIRDHYAYIFTEKYQGPGGLPLGTQGNVLCIIDSTQSLLAAWYLMKRGCAVDFFITRDDYTEQLHTFQKRWFSNGKVIHSHQQKATLIDMLSQFNDHQHYQVIVLGKSLYASKPITMPEVQLLKKQLQMPIVFPLLSFDDSMITQRCQELGINL